jgi:hypothetical protein
VRERGGRGSGAVDMGEQDTALGLTAARPATTDDLEGMTGVGVRSVEQRAEGGV